MAFPRPQVTAVGRALLTKVMDGEPLEFTRIKMGSGSLTDVSADRLTNLVYTEASIEISQILRGDDYVSIRGIFSNEDVTTGFYWREVGLFAKDPIMGEILFAYANAGSIADYITPATASEIVRTVVMVVSISNASEITLVVDESLTYATWEDLQDLAESVRKSFENVNNKFTNITNIIQQVTGVDPDDPNAAPSGSMVVTLTHEKSGTVHTFTGLGERTGLVPCQFKSTAGYTEGDTATIDGTAYTITLTSADAPETDLFVSGKSIIVDVDTESKTINFKAGGGLTKAKLALATATEDTVFNGKTFYAGSKVLRTGRALATATNVTAAKMFAGTTAYNQQGQLITGNPAATNVTAAKMFTGTTAFDRNGNLITGAPTKTNVQASDIARGKKAYTDAGALLTGTGRTVLAGSIQPTIEYKTYTISYPSGVSGKPKAIVAYFNVWVGEYATAGQQPSFSPYFYRGAVSGQLDGITTAVSGTMRNQNQSSANTTIDINSNNFNVNFNKYDYISGSEFCYILIW